ncbi:hypothetical protein BS47DRAFT_1360646 [Hydnum rufescens UP504]|uniref:Uncharacterized protein n=1 Tax=Hydnum rufescens UP504 TaxID=1448309 RepID=A0A9P6B2B7_9AGAM|nr:hypothetical protein BS47DRAFT_1360646 [Hydnum rufescens UP504]
MDVHSQGDPADENDENGYFDDPDDDWSPYSHSNNRISFLAPEDEDMDDPDDKDIYGQDKKIQKQISLASKAIDRDWVPGHERKWKALNSGKGHPKTYQTGPDISRKAPCTQQHYAKEVAMQGTLDTFISLSKGPPSPIYVSSQSSSLIPPDAASPGSRDLNESNTLPPLAPLPHLIPAQVPAVSRGSHHSQRNVPGPEILKDSKDLDDDEDEIEHLGQPYVTPLLGVYSGA